MKLTKAIAAAAVFVCGITWLPALSSYASEDPLVDSGIDYTESMETLLNPGAGYSSTVAVNCKPNDTKVYNPTSSLVVLFVDIGAFSSGANGTTNEDGTYVDGTDYDLNETFFTNFRKDDWKLTEKRNAPLAFAFDTMRMAFEIRNLLHLNRCAGTLNRFVRMAF